MHSKNKVLLYILLIFQLIQPTRATNQLTNDSRSESLVGANALAPQELIKLTPEGYVNAEVRLNVLSEMLNQRPDLGISTRIPSSATLWPLYMADKSFIEKRIADRSNKATMLSALDHIHQKALTFGWDREMSVSDMNAIGKLWVSILSTAPESQVIKLTSYYEARSFQKLLVIQSDLDHCLEKAYIDRYFSDYQKASSDHPWHVCHGFFLPHVSPTGFVPIDVIRKAWAFFRPGAEEATYLDLLAVPTDVIVDFDYARGLCAADAYDHDLGHAGRYRYLSKFFALEYSKIIARALSKYASIDADATRRADIAFLHVFHEEGHAIYFPNASVAEYARVVSYRLSNPIARGEAFNSLEQYEAYVDVARGLGINLQGASTIEKYRGYLGLLLEGLKTLEQFFPVETVQELLLGLEDLDLSRNTYSQAQLLDRVIFLNLLDPKELDNKRKLTLDKVRAINMNLFHWQSPFGVIERQFINVFKEKFAEIDRLHALRNQPQQKGSWREERRQQLQGKK